MIQVREVIELRGRMATLVVAQDKPDHFHALIGRFGIQETRQDLHRVRKVVDLSLESGYAREIPYFSEPEVKDEG
jgi:hypothetical protein